MMKISLQPTEYHRFTLSYDYTQDRVDFCRSLKESFGWQKFSFNNAGFTKCWVFSDSFLIPVIKERFPETEIDPEVQALVSKEQSWASEAEKKNKIIDEVKVKKDTDFNVKGLKKEMYAYQKVGVEFLVHSGGRAIVADAPGLGKTIQALAYTKHMGYGRTLVVCPASVKFTWENEVKKWTRLSSIVIDSKTDLASIDPDINYWIINYDILKKHHNQLIKTRFDAIIGDECQLIKTPSAIRTKSFRMISRNIPSIILLSGTPLLSRPSELFSLLNIIDQSAWNNFYDFARRYCAAHQTRWGMDTSGASNTEELHARIKRYFIRRDKTEVLKELPPKNFISVPMELDKEFAKQYDAAASNLAAYLRIYEGKQPPDITKMMNAEKLTQLNVLRQLNAEGKVDTAMDLIESIIDAGEKVLVFSSFIEPLEELQRRLKGKAVIITGKTPVEERGGIVEKFQNDPNISVFLGGYRSAGVGLTLTAAQNFIGIDFPWNPADLSQAVDRLHRPGQVAESVNIYQIEAKDTIDEDMKVALGAKQDIFDQVVGGKVAIKRGQEAMDLALERIVKNY